MNRSNFYFKLSELNLTITYFANRPNFHFELTENSSYQS